MEATRGSPQRPTPRALANYCASKRTDGRRQSGPEKSLARDLDTRSVEAMPRVSSLMLRRVAAAVLLIYLALPAALLLLFRYPEISALLAEADGRLLPTLALISIVVTYKYGARGLAPLLAVAIGLLKYEMDACLWHPPEDLSLAGKVAVITGGNSGLGFATAKALVRCGAHVVITCRSAARCEAAARDIATEGRNSGGTVATELLDLSGSVQSVVAAAERISARHERIHYLFNNAGSTPQHSLTREGLEDGFGSMRLAHVAFTLGLLPSLRSAGEETDPARIVMVSSEAGVTKASSYLLQGIPAFHPSLLRGDGEGDLRGEVTRGDGTVSGSFDAYARAKLCNILFAKELHRRLRTVGWPIATSSLHTGAVATKTSSEGLEGALSLLPGMGAVSRYLIPLLWRSPDEGASLLLHAALTDLHGGGVYLNGMGRPVAATEETHRRLKSIQPHLAGASWPEKIRMLFGVPQSQVLAYALRLVDDTYSRRLWDVSLHLLEGSLFGEMIGVLESARK